jgi:hypothetical protein
MGGEIASGQIASRRLRGALVGGRVGLRRAGGLPACRVATAGESFDVQRGAAEQQLDVE